MSNCHIEWVTQCLSWTVAEWECISLECVCVYCEKFSHCLEGEMLTVCIDLLRMCMYTKKVYCLDELVGIHRDPQNMNTEDAVPQ